MSVFDRSSAKLRRADSSRQDLPTHFFIMDLQNIKMYLTFYYTFCLTKQNDNDIFYESDVTKTEQGMKARTGRHLSTIPEHQRIYTTSKPDIKQPNVPKISKLSHQSTLHCQSTHYPDQFNLCFLHINSLIAQHNQNTTSIQIGEGNHLSELMAENYHM